jgi:hypothetical protein
MEYRFIRMTLLVLAARKIPARRPDSSAAIQE